MKKEKRKALLIRMFRFYTLQVTLITVLLIILGMLLDRDRVFSYEAFLSPLIYALISTVITAAMHTERELSAKRLMIREGVSLLLVEAVFLFIALRAATIPTDRAWVVPGIALGILAVFLLTNLIMYLSDRKEAEKLSADLVRYQQEQDAQN